MTRRSDDPLTSKTAAGDQQLSSYRFVIAGILALLSFSFGLSMFSVSPVTPLIMDEYRINRGTASLLVSLIPLVHIVLAIPGSMLVGRIRLKNLVVLASVLGSAPLLSLLAVNFPILLSLRVVYAIGMAVMFPAVGSLAMQWFRPRELPVFNGLFVAALSLGTALSSFTIAPISQAIGWKVGLSILGGVSLVGTVCWLVLGRAQQLSAQTEQHLSIKGALSVVRSRSTILIAAADAGPYALLAAAVAWLPTYYHEVHGMSLARAGSLMGLFSLAGTISLVSASLLVLRVRRRRPLLVIPGVVAGFAGFGSFLLADTVFVYVAVLALGFACWFYLPILLTIPMELPGADANRVALTFGALMSVGGIFSFVSPLTVGITTDLLGSYLPGLTLFSILSWSLAISGNLLPETGEDSPVLTGPSE